jgi:hypothetical protein
MRTQRSNVADRTATRMMSYSKSRDEEGTDMHTRYQWDHSLSNHFNLNAARYPGGPPITCNICLEDVCVCCRPSGPTLRTGLTYLIATAITSAAAITIMLINAGDTNYRSDQELCTCDCFDRRFKGINFDNTMQYRQVIQKAQLANTN